MLHLVVLGAAAGGGFPQWNCNDATAHRVRAGDLNVLPSTQSSVAVSADGKRWILLNASPDLRQQINERRALWPSQDAAPRSSPIAAVVLTSADVDHITGLLNLRESQRLALYGHQRVLGALARNSIFNVLHPDCVPRRPLPLEEPTVLTDGDGKSLDLTIKAFAVPGKIALWLEDLDAPDLGTDVGDAIGLEVSSVGSPSFFYIPGCAGMSSNLAMRLRGASMVLFDGTLWRDDEMIATGVGTKTGQRMGHMSCTGSGGTIAAFEGLDIARKIFIHINNTNPLLITNSPERAEAGRHGWEVAYDGMEIIL